jgi:hypothetical protein
MVFYSHPMYYKEKPNFENDKGANEIKRLGYLICVLIYNIYSNFVEFFLVIVVTKNKKL